MITNDNTALKNYLLNTLYDLADVEQHPRYHPEGNALYHSLQVFDLAYQRCNDPIIHAAALFHDIGKAIDSKTHAKIGSDMLEGIFNSEVRFLILHHLDLLTAPSRTRAKYSAQPILAKLELLRTFDTGGRDPYTETRSPEEAVTLVLKDYLLTRAL